MAVSDGNGNCCSCGQLVGCACGGIACSTSCRSKSGLAELCGFSEFASPSAPPKKYKRKNTTGNMTISRFGDDECGGLIGLPAALECRSKSGTATLCGFSEYTTPSSPPKKYRKQTWSGQILGCTFVWDPCDTPKPDHHTHLRVYSGSYVFDQATCAETDSSFYEDFSDLDIGCTSPTTLTSHVALGPNVPASIQGGLGFSHARNITGPTTVFYTVGGACFEWFGKYYTDTCSVEVALQEEDTEADAIARAIAAAVWSAAGGCTTHTSYKQVRTSGFSLGYSQAQTRAVISGGLTVGANYEVRIRLYRRAVGTADPFVDSGQDLIASFTAAAATHTTDWLDVPIEASWEYRAEIVSVYGDLLLLTQDTWNIADQWDAACTALTTTDNSTRTEDGVQVPGPFASSPPDAYAEGGRDVDSQPAERTTTGNDACLNVGIDAYDQHTGQVTETLLDEDTDAAALARAQAAIADWSAVGPCVDKTAFQSQRTSGFSFEFRAAQVQVAWTAVVTTTYKVTVRFARRLLGTSGPFLYFAQEEQTLVADVTNETSGWIDLPNEAGYETIAANCSVEVV